MRYDFSKYQGTYTIDQAKTILKKMKKELRGGKRKGAGRKKIKDKKMPVTMWYQKSVINHYGGMKKFKLMIDQLIKSYAEV